MRYKDFDGSAEELIQSKLNEIEKREQVRILHAVESGSRAWGFASPDSDYDVRFVYVRPVEYYLGLEAKKDYLDWELDEILDMNGWDLSKALRHFRRSNATLFEWSNSPIIYRTTKEWSRIKETSLNYFSAKSCMYHYYGTANKNFHEYLQDDMVKYKKYFYVLRPILACKWIEEKKCPPPVLFSGLQNAVLDEQLKPLVSGLLEKKMKMKEYEKGPRLDELNTYICQNLLYYKELTANMEDDRNPDWKVMNQLFRSVLDY